MTTFLSPLSTLASNHSTINRLGNLYQLVGEVMAQKGVSEIRRSKATTQG